MNILKGKSAILVPEMPLGEILFDTSRRMGSSVCFCLCWDLPAICREGWSWTWTRHTFFLFCKQVCAELIGRGCEDTTKHCISRVTTTDFSRLSWSSRVLIYLPIRASDGWSDILFARTNWAWPAWYTNHSCAISSGFLRHDLVLFNSAPSPGR